ncbi:stemmadenine O-acetyltransferase-like [Euphorbia lathyris]|uniref:stemmadenine O-acetyltransferase-like n=1 Tax=Euphorbia lathyris TaxID=212925 RepID=UPI0033131705
MEVERISEMLIKPSSSTPPHLRTYKISLLDQFMPPIYIPIILFYPNQLLPNNTSLLLKQSLSETLTRFYPLAGKIKDDHLIDCNDEGSYYVNARVNNISLSDYLNPSDPTPTLHKLLPKQVRLQEASPGSYVSMIQETRFRCGGIAIGVQFSHMAMDGVAVASFLKTWAKVANKSVEAAHVLPYFDAVSVFPHYDEFPREVMLSSNKLLMRLGKVVTKRFMFEPSSLELLKVKATSSSVENPTRVEVVSALLCKSMKGIHVNKTMALTVSVNLRTRANPPFPECSMGNILWPTTAMLPNETEVKSLVESIRGTIRKIDSESVKNIQGIGGFVKLASHMSKELGSGKSLEHVVCTSWCNFGLYGVDFGWGKPLWVSCAGSESNSEAPYFNSIVLMDAKMEKGIEAWVYMDEDELSLMEKDENLLAYASVNASPLKHGL